MPGKLTRGRQGNINQRPKKNAVALTGWMPTPWGIVKYEGYLESQLMAQLIMDPKVKYFERAPKISYGNGKRYTPDIYLEYTKGLVPPGHEYYILEVKPSKTLKKNREKFAERFAAAAKQATEAGMQFRILSEVEIMPRAEAVSALSRCRDVEVDLTLSCEITNAVKRAPGITAEALTHYFPNRKDVLPTAWAMVYLGQLHIDLTKKPTNFSRLYLKLQDTWPVVW